MVNGMAGDPQSPRLAPGGFYGGRHGGGRAGYFRTGTRGGIAISPALGPSPE